jgi:hypothetical protein
VGRTWSLRSLKEEAIRGLREQIKTDEASTHLHPERNGKFHRILQDFLDLFFNTRDCHALYWAREPDPVMEKKDMIVVKALSL